MNAILDIIKSRRSIRRYKNEQITEDALAKILEAGRFAPSGHNNQTAHYVVIQKRDVLNELRDIVKGEFAKMDLPEDNHNPMSAAIRLSKAGKYNFMYNPPTFIIAANKRNYGNAMADCTLGLGYMMLAANTLNIGTCWINQLRWLNDNPVVIEYLKKLGISETEIVCGSLAVGYADQSNLAAVPIRGNRVDFIR